MVALHRRKPQPWQGPGSLPKDINWSPAAHGLRDRPLSQTLRPAGDQGPEQESGRAQHTGVTRPGPSRDKARVWWAVTPPEPCVMTGDSGVVLQGSGAVQTHRCPLCFSSWKENGLPSPLARTARAPLHEMEKVDKWHARRPGLQSAPSCFLYCFGALSMLCVCVAAQARPDYATQPHCACSLPLFLLPWSFPKSNHPEYCKPAPPLPSCILPFLELLFPIWFSGECITDPPQ